MSESFSLNLVPGSLDLDRTLASGQVFRWKRLGPHDWTGPLDGAAVRLALASPGSLRVRHPRGEAARAAVEEFLRLDADLAGIHQELCRRDSRLEPLFRKHQGLRLLRQEPVECLLSFVCAVVTNIPRISMSLDEVCRAFGAEAGEGVWLWPALEVLAAVEPEALRVGGLEFRCRSLSRAARALLERGGEDYLRALRRLSYEEAFAELVTLPHVGPKVADCVLLFALGFDEAFPLDTHTWRAACRLYGEPGEALSPRRYLEMSRRLRRRLGPRAGWAQQYLFFDSLEVGRRPVQKRADPADNPEVSRPPGG